MQIKEISSDMASHSGQSTVPNCLIREHNGIKIEKKNEKEKEVGEEE